MKHVTLFLFIVWSSLLFAQNQGIPTSYMNDAAVDLTRNGQLLQQDEVHELHTSSRGRFDISTLNPVETSDLWKNVFLKTLPVEITPINDNDEVTYHSNIISTTGAYRFNILNSNGDKKIYNMMINKGVHSALLIKSLLRKIGYTVPDIKRLSQVTVKFRDENQKLSFLSYLEKEAYAGSPAHWVVEDLGDKLVLQDVVVTTANNSIFNLAFGLHDDNIQGRRLMSAISVPHAIVNLAESVNLLRWNVGVIQNNKIALDLNKLEDYATTWDDARWITRRIEKLTREDWKEIVASTQIPKVVQQVLLEKIISRRNNMMRLFKIDAEQMPVDNKINSGVELVNGKITQQKWPGYGSRFAHGDPESPLSDSDMKSWIKSRAISTVMEIAMAQINQLPYLGTDIEKLGKAEYQKHIEAAVAKSVLEKKEAVMPIKSWVFPTFRGNLIFSRNLVTGTYLGTDKLVQLVDTVGATVSAGLYLGTMGISTKKPMSGGKEILPVNVSAGANAAYMRTYAHLRPVVNIKRSLKYKFKNILVPLVKRDLGKLLHEAYMTTIDPNASEDDRSQAVAKALKPFKDVMNIGESILVTDTLLLNTGAQAGAKISGNILSAALGISANNILLSRFHVHRRDEDSFHVYKDIGQKASVSTSLNIDSLVPLISVNFKKSGGHAKVKFYSLDLGKKNPKVFDNAQALRGAIVNSSVEELEEKGIKPYILKHKFNEASPSANLLFFQFIQQDSQTEITVQNPLGEERYFRRFYHGNTVGKNYQAYVNAVVNHWVGMLFDKGAGLSDATGTNPGYSFKGQAKTKYATMDQELDAEGNVTEPFVSINRVWNGWSISREKAEKLLEEIRHQYKFTFYDAPILNDTSKIYLYNIGATIRIYEKGLEHLLGLDEKKIKRIFYEHQIQHSLVVNPSVEAEEENEDWEADKYEETGVNKFLRLLKRYRKLDLKGSDARSNKNLLKALSYMEKSVYLPGIALLMGGTENIYAYARIEGFREGDEAGDRGITSNAFGQYGSPRVLGPVVQMQQTTNMLEGEFFINWMMQRLI